MESFSNHMRSWRSRRGLSQMALGLNSGTSPRHISFLETGRSRPSRKMVLRLAQAMDLPLREQNRLLNAAGFAPLFGERPIEDDALREARSAVKLLLTAHEPYPAMVVDRYWQLVAWNRPQLYFLRELTDDVGSLSHVNALDLVFQPGGMREQFLNWNEVATAVLRRLNRQRARVGDDRRLEALWERALATPGTAKLMEGVGLEDAPPPLVPMRMRQEGKTVTWVNTLASFGATGDATLEELVIESFFPADEETRVFARSVANLRV